MTNSAPITFEQLFRFYRGLPHQMAAILMLEEDIKRNGYEVAMRRDREWFKVWIQDGKIADESGRKIPPYLLLTRTKQRDSRGLDLLRLQRFKDGVPMGELLVVSGAPGRQSFRKGAASVAGSLEPLPEGLWAVDDIAWAGGPNNYNASWGEGLGPASILLQYLKPGLTPRSAIAIHYDANHGYSPGTAGCIGMRSIADLKALIGWLRADDPRQLFVNHGLGSCPPVPS
jgi:hypothetical protein